MKHATTLVLETPRLRLRQWRESDRALIRAMGADARVMRHFDGTQTTEQSDAFFDRIRDRISERGFGFWACELRESEQLIGILGLFHSRFLLPFPNDELEIGWRLHPDFWGYGYATEGARAVLDFGFCTMNQKRLWAVTALTNAPSQAVMTRVGMSNAQLDFDHPGVENRQSPVLRHCTFCITRDHYLNLK